MNIFRRFGTWLFTKPSRDKAPRRARLSLEALEERTVLSVNPIIAENQLPGTPQSVWDVPGAGDPTIQGFATDISVNQGQTVNFKINDTARAPYHLDIYRLGYYQGLGARLITTIGSSQTLDVVQPSPKFDPNTALVDAGNWSTTASWAVPASATSGVYFARVTRNDTGGAFMILFIVRSDTSHSQVLYQTNDATWEAYNTWGGYSLYQATGTTQGPGASGSAYAVSYNRPLIDRGTPGGLGDTNSFFYDEYPMVRWMEANGYDVSYSTNLDADRAGSLILNHQLFVAAGHDEYWSGNQFNNVMAARDAGVNLAFFTGNEVFWKTYYAPSIDGSNTPNRTLVDYKETHANAIIDPNNPNVWTGTWMDPRFSPPADGGRPQNQLTGTLFTVNRGPNDTGTPFTVPYADSQSRFWRNTSVAALQPGQTATLGDYELGYEWDEDVDNGFRPAGLIDLSSTTQSVTQKFLDYGNTTAAGTATHSLTLYRAKSGSLVFGAGTVQYDWGLDGFHDGPSGQLGFNSATVLALQQATVNLFADMNVQPATLQAGLVAATASTDVTPPASAITAPTGGASLKTGSSVTITGTAADTGGGKVAGVEVSVDGGQTWHPATGTTNWTYTWIPDTAGQVTIRSRATDDSNNTETPSAGFTVSVTSQPTSRTGLVAEYGFGDGAGLTLSDTSGNHNNGTIANATWATGLFGGKALSFNGVNSWVTVPNSASLNLTNGMTLEAWVEPAALNDWAAVLMKERPGGLSYALYADNGANQPPAGFVHATSGDSEALGKSALPLNVWSQLAVTYDGSDLLFYVNGTLMGSQSVGANIVTSNGVLRIGGDSIWGEYFNGLIDQIRVYNRPLNQGEIRSDMSTPIGGSLDTTAPTVSLAGPTAGATVSGTVTVSANASDNVYVAGVQFLLDGQPLGAEVTATPYSNAWNTLGVANGSHTLSARVRDMVGNVSTSAAETVLVSNSTGANPPTVAITYPTTNFAASGPVVLNSIASDSIGVTSVQYQLNGANIGPALTSAPYRLLWDPSTVTSGTYTLTAVAKDLPGSAATSAPVSVTVDHTPPTVLGATPTAGTAGVSTASSLTAQFSKAVQSGTISFTLQDPSGSTIQTQVVYDDATHTATFTHGSLALDPLTAYTATISGVKDLAGNVIATPFSWSFSTGNAITGATIWQSTVVPAVTAANDSGAVEVGVKFRADVAGTVTAIRFYKGSTNTGTHVGHLWDSAGNLLGTVTFSGETAFGWQTAQFATPVAISANVTYVVSYYAPNGNYAADANYFATSGVNSGPLHALVDGGAGNNGVYLYTTAGGFPTNSFSATNYWVDVVFNSTTQSGTPPTVIGDSPVAGTTGVALATAVTATFSKSVQAGTVAFVLKDASGNSVAAAVSYASGTNTATLTPSTALAASATYTATVSGAQDLAGNTMTLPFSWSFSTANPSAPPAVVAVTPVAGTAGVAKGTTITALFSKAVASATMSFTLKDAAGNVVSATVSYSDESNVATLTPSAGLAPGTTYTATVSGAQDLAGNAMTAPFSWSFSTAFAIVGNTIWSPTVTPTVASSSDSGAVELGVRFSSDTTGYITGLRFYKGTGNTGTHVGHLWDAAGNLLATATFSVETASGWQQVSLANPVAVTAGASYVASYFAPAGHYAADAGYFASAVNNAPLHVLASGANAGNGLYHYGSSGGFPDQSYNATNYWVDVIFSTTNPDTTPPTVTGATPVSGAAGTDVMTTVTATFSEAVQASTISIVLKDPSGNAVAGTTVYDAVSRTATFTPSAALNPSATYTATVSGTQDLAGNVMTATGWTFTTGATLFGHATPAVASASDTGSIEVGMKFSPDVTGTIYAIRFYKGAGNTGTHVGHLWDAAGNLLATATFSGETASGWQQVSLANPVAVTAGTPYVVSYYAPNGGYAANGAYFTAGADTGLLSAPAGGTGVYHYGSGGGFPTDSYNSSNYWVDVVFVASNTPDTTPPTVTGETPGSGATGTDLATTVTATFSEAVQSSTITFVLKDPSGNAVAGATVYDAVSRTATFTPSAALTPSTAYTATVSGAKDVVGNTMTLTFWTFTTGGTTFFNHATPAVTSVNDTSAVELGMKFIPTKNGQVTAIRFYKGTGNTGTHVGHLWDAAGNLLATITFTNETATGWQTAVLSTPVNLTAGTTYVVSYYAPNGGYAANAGYFATATTDSSGELTAPAGSTGVYHYGSVGGFPTDSYNSTNYWVDVVFVASA